MESENKLSMFKEGGCKEAAEYRLLKNYRGFLHAIDIDRRMQHNKLQSCWAYLIGLELGITRCQKQGVNVTQLELQELLKTVLANDEGEEK